jgi:hypothetical protein
MMLDMYYNVDTQSHHHGFPSYFTLIIPTHPLCTYRILAYLWQSTKLSLLLATTESSVTASCINNDDQIQQQPRQPLPSPRLGHQSILNFLLP